MLRSLQNAKVAGQEFSLLGLTELQRVCRQGAVDLSGAIQATATRDAMLRIAIQETLKQVAAVRVPRGGAALGAAPREFVCGLAASLGVPDARTVTLVSSGVAADARARLLQITVERRSGRLHAAARERAALGAVLTAFPLAEDAAEAELVGAGLRDKFTALELEAVLKELVSSWALGWLTW